MLVWRVPPLKKYPESQFVLKYNNLRVPCPSQKSKEVCSILREHCDTWYFQYQRLLSRIELNSF